ncbi:nitroreductase family protein [Paenibacillus selenitireducens]|uniref:Nitroreductase family protein n=1 Tax=Paenibacillus selenitireducens TaxID=1324314 RepID=A0A1T2X5V5_9BACL|nr:nitroreductase family protein [Paenibacillus selenitireducens]OPA75257.1 nitroreductase family protein [Paenibacillus selenitireducens]
MTTFENLIKERRSAMKFIPDIEISRQELDEIFALTTLAPSAFNLQHTQYVVLQDQEMLNQLYDRANKQYKVKTASAVIIVLGDTLAYQNIAQLNEGFLHLGVLSKQEYDAENDGVTQFYENRGEAYLAEDAIRNASISATHFMLSAKSKGWDTCPMSGFDGTAIRDLLHIHERYVIAMMIAVGKSDPAKLRPRGYRKPVAEFVQYGAF